jgi:uptake hydrogenase large subunit
MLHRVVGPRSADGARGPVEEALIGAPIADPHDPVEVGHVCRSYDSCFVCTVHAHDARTGQEPRAFANRLIAQPWENRI